MPRDTTDSATPRDGVRRLAYVDTLRVYGVLLVLVVHVCQVFNPWDEWHIVNAARSRIAGEVVVLLAPWIMPLMMLLAGVSSWYSLRRRGNGQYLRERTTRVLLPLIAGTLLLVPPQVYLERRLRGQFAGSFVAFYPSFFHGFYPEGNLSWHHLWFLAHLYGYSILALPLFRFLQHARGARALDTAARFCSGPAGVAWLALPLVVERTLLWGLFPERHMLTADWSNHALLFVAYVYGFLLAGAPWLGAVIDAQWQRALVTAATGSAAIMGGAWVGVLPGRLPPPYASPYLAFWTLYALVAWLWMVAILGIARRSGAPPGAVVRHGAPRAYLWYVVHQPVVVGAAFLVVGWRAGVPAKLAALTVLSVVGTVVASESIRRIPLVSALLGAGRIRRATAAPAPPAPPAPATLPRDRGNFAGPATVAVVSQAGAVTPPGSTSGARCGSGAEHDRSSAC